MNYKGYNEKSEGAASLTDKINDAVRLLEKLLSYAKDVTDINATAANLASVFKRVDDCFFAPCADLLSVDGMTLEAAALMKLIGQVYTACENGYFMVFDHVTLDEVLRSLTEETTEETVWALSVDEIELVTIVECLAVGETARAGADVRAAALFAGRHEARRVVLAHYHPSRKKPRLSRQDMLAMQYIGDSLGRVGITLIGQMIITYRGSKFFRYAFD